MRARVLHHPRVTKITLSSNEFRSRGGWKEIGGGTLSADPETPKTPALQPDRPPPSRRPGTQPNPAANSRSSRAPGAAHGGCTSASQPQPAYSSVKRSLFKDSL